MEPVTFGIPLVSRRVAPDWDAVQALLAATLGSIFNQKGAEVRAIIACHEPPTIPEASDPRVTIVEVPFDIPRFRWELQIDQMRKMEAAAAQHRKAGGGLMFVLDADDLVAEGLAARLAASPAKAFVIRRGYRLDVAQNRYQLLNKFYGKCGSCVGVRWTIDELPEVALGDEPSVFHAMCEQRHFQWPAFFAAKGWTIDYIDDPSVAYLINHGSNQSDVNIRLSLKWRIYFALTRWKRWSAALDRRFGVSQAARAGALYRGPAQYSVSRGL